MGGTKEMWGGVLAPRFCTLYRDGFLNIRYEKVPGIAIFFINVYNFGEPNTLQEVCGGGQKQYNSACAVRRERERTKNKKVIFVKI